MLPRLGLEFLILQVRAYICMYVCMYVCRDIHRYPYHDSLARLCLLSNLGIPRQGCERERKKVFKACGLLLDGMATHVRIKKAAFDYLCPYLFVLPQTEDRKHTITLLRPMDFFLFSYQSLFIVGRSVFFDRCVIDF
ncbi:hypothetical protein M426DRAFT_185123 [Hypoxylon sp. CI-4A]|nr:hypothetical protein M426DRAFT_185123 [Hypoxylon sp. CI-4A]